MFALIVISTLAAVIFHRRTREKGYHSPRFWMYPLIVGNGLLLFSRALQWIVIEVVQPSASPLMRIYGYVVELLTMVLLVIIIGKAWKQIQSLPPLE